MYPQIPPGNGGRSDGPRRYVWLAISVTGAVLSFFANLYLDQVRQILEWTWSRLAIEWILFSLILFVCSYTTWHVRGSLLKRKLERLHIIENLFTIRTDEFEDDVPADHAIAGRRLHYLERKTDSETLAIFLHGLGLDANDFRPYMQTAREHTIAVTMFGFNTEEANDSRYPPVGITTHAFLLSQLINALHRSYPGKRLVLVGFSLGADMLLRLAQLWRELPGRQPAVTGMLLLDPNINHSTMAVSKGVSSLDESDPMTALKRIVVRPETLIEFHNICEYLHKITTKNLAQVRRFASEMVDYWEPDGHYDLFLQRIVDLQRITPRVKIIFSAHYEDHFGDIMAEARKKHLNREIFYAENVDHFELIRETLLKRELAGLAAARYPKMRLASQ